MNEFYTRVCEYSHQITYTTDSMDNFRAVERLCRELIGHGKPTDKETPIEPLWEQNDPVCGECRKPLLHIIKQNYCYHCGKKVKWNE